MAEDQANRPAPDSQDPGSSDATEKHPQTSTRRSFITGGIRKAAYVAPVIWSISARQALAGSLAGSAFMQGTGGPGGPPTPE